MASTLLAACLNPAPIEFALLSQFVLPRNIPYQMSQSDKLTLNSRFLLVVFCLFPLALWAQSVKVPMTLSTNSGTTGASGTIKGYLGQPIVGSFGTTSPGAVAHSGYVKVLMQVTALPTASPEQPVTTPLSFGLHQNFPNPFNPSTVIPFSLDRLGQGELVIFNLLGQQVQVFDLSSYSPGDHLLTWDGKSRHGGSVPSGEYFARLSHDNRVQVRKLTLLK